jgi:uncharacterized protein YjbJ (UPF0337 family)
MTGTTSPSKVSGNAAAAMGTVKESIGSAIGNRSMEADGAAQRAKGNAEVEAAKAQGYAKGTIDNVSGNVKNAAGQVLGNEQMRAEGEAERLKGKTQQEVNK